jgi:hypothetical protein
MLDMLRYLIFALLLAVTPATAAQVSPSFGLDGSGTLRNLSVTDPSGSGSGDDKRTPIGTLDTSTHLFSAVGTLSTVAAAANYHPNFPPAYIRTLGYSVVGTGGALYAKVGSQPSHAYKFSITNAAGATVWYEIAPSERPVNPEQVGAIAGDGTDDSTPLQNAINSGFPVTGLGKSYRVAATIGLKMADGMDLRDITLVRTAVDNTSIATMFGTLTNVAVHGVSASSNGPYTLKNVKIDYTAIATDQGNANRSFGLDIRISAHDVNIDGLEVTGNGLGTAVYIASATRVYVHNLYVHDLEWTATVDPATESAAGLILHTTTDSQVSDFRVENIAGVFPWVTGQNIVGAGLSWRTNAGKAYRATTLTGTTGASAPTCSSGTCSDGSVTWTYMGPSSTTRRYYQGDGVDVTNVLRATFDHGSIRNVWEGFDAVGANNTDVYLSNITYTDIDAYGEKWGHCVTNAGSNNSRIVRAGLDAFIIYNGISTDDCGPSHLRILNPIAINTAASGNWPAASITLAGYRIGDSGAPGYKPISDVRLINPSAVDDQLVPTMVYGIATETSDPTKIVLINPHVAGATTPYYGFTSGVTEVLSTDGSTKITGNEAVTGNLAVTGTTALTGAATASSTLGVSGATTLSSTLGVTGAATFSHSATISSAQQNLLLLYGTHDNAFGTGVLFRHLHTAAANDALADIYFSGNDSVGTLTNYGQISAISPVVTDGAETGAVLVKTATATSLIERLRVAQGVIVGAGGSDPGNNNLLVNGTEAVTGAATVGGTLGVTGATTLSSTLGVTGAITATGGIVGTATNNNATAGNVGEYTSATLSSGSAISLTTNTAASLTSISLTAGDWDVSSNVIYTPAATTSISRLLSAVSTTNNTLDFTEDRFAALGEAAQIPGLNINTTSRVSNARFSISGTTTVYLVAFATFTASTITAYGKIWARRVR